ncbi:MAG: hypothetical protein R6X02_12200 [Enhygromyxa sp.]
MGRTDRIGQTMAKKSMKSVQSAIESHVDSLSQKHLFRALNASSDIEDLRRIAPHGYFYVLAFQDMLRIAHSKIADPVMQEMALSLRMGDAGHDMWFLSDMEILGTSRDVRWIFGEEHQPVRDLTYGLIAELLRANTDANRLVFPLVLEGAASVFFTAMVDLVRRTGASESLSYFAPLHEDAEHAHDIFTAESQAKLDSIEFSSTAFEEALSMVSRCFDCFERFADHLEGWRLRAG